eukprot:2014712-Pleurochrysis_carterae.AAC.1
MEKKNEHKASVQRRWDHRGKTLKLFMRWKRTVGYIQDEQERHDGGKGKEIEEAKKEKTHGIKYWGRVRSIPRIHIGQELSAEGHWMMIIAIGYKIKLSSRNGFLRIPEAYILVKGVIAIPYHTHAPHLILSFCPTATFHISICYDPGAQMHEELVGSAVHCRRARRVSLLTARRDCTLPSGSDRIHMFTRARAVRRAS